MFIKSFRLTPLRILAVSCGLVACVLGILFFALPDRSESGEETSAKIKVKSESDIRVYLSTFGWTLSESGSHDTITIPSDWNSTFENYNTIQKLQGFDLSSFKGKEVTKYTWEILNYPESDDTMLVNVLVYNQKVIGGDISTSRADGFMHGFAMPEASLSSADTASDVSLVTPVDADSSSESEIIPEK